MMSFLKKKKFKFTVDFLLVDLIDVPFLNAVLFSKVRLLEGGSFCEMSPRVDVVSHRVCWDQIFRFSCRIASNPQTGVLEQCICRVSIRKELKGGRSYQKLGYVDINLSEFAGSGVNGQQKSYILEEYSSSHQRQDNSKLRVNIGMNLLSSDPFFKVPVHPSPSESGQIDPEDRRAEPSVNPSGPAATMEDGHSVNSGSSGIGSSKEPNMQEDDAVSMPGHSRNASQTSQSSGQSSHPVLGGLGSGHSRQSSMGGEQPNSGSLKVGGRGHERRPSSDKSLAPISTNSSSAKVGSTRVDPEGLINEILQSEFLAKGIQPNEEESTGLSLFILKDGTAALGSYDPRSHFAPDGSEKVIVPVPAPVD